MHTGRVQDHRFPAHPEGWPGKAALYRVAWQGCTGKRWHGQSISCSAKLYFKSHAPCSRLHAHSSELLRGQTLSTSARGGARRSCTHLWCTMRDACCCRDLLTKLVSRSRARRAQRAQLLARTPVYRAHESRGAGRQTLTVYASVRTHTDTHKHT